MGGAWRVGIWWSESINSSIQMMMREKGREHTIAKLPKKRREERGEGVRERERRIQKTKKRKEIKS